MKFYKYITLIFGIVLLFGCSKLQKELPEPTSPLVIHTSGWNDTSSNNFHGKYLKAKNWKKDDCVQCHASDFSGGTSKVSCYNCHEYPHKKGYLDKASENYHGKFLKTVNWNLTACQKCHGVDFIGGTTEVSCYQCHNSYPHYTGWEIPANITFHGKFLKNNQWNLNNCKNCHGDNYAGGEITNISCLTTGCHIDKDSNPKSPEACNTCHGNFSDPADLVTSWAPPKSIDNNIDSTFRGVGAHQIHLVTGKLGKSLKCSECHNVPTQVFVAGHLDSELPAEVVMNDTLARLVTANGLLVPAPEYNNIDLKCSNVYCHGNWRLRRATSTNQFGYEDSVMVGANYSPKWTGGAKEAECGICHALPPTGHIAATVQSCGNCHNGVVNNQGVIIDKSKHINGKINVFGQEKWMN